jgi:hypothetical protein
MNKTGFGKIAVGVVCTGVFVNGFIHALDWTEVGISAAVWLGAAFACFVWAWKDRKKAAKASGKLAPSSP